MTPLKPAVFFDSPTLHALTNLLLASCELRVARPCPLPAPQVDSMVLVKRNLGVRTPWSHGLLHLEPREVKGRCPKLARASRDKPSSNRRPASFPPKHDRTHDYRLACATTSYPLAEKVLLALPGPWSAHAKTRPFFASKTRTCNRCVRRRVHVAVEQRWQAVRADFGF